MENFSEDEDTYLQNSYAQDNYPLSADCHSSFDEVTDTDESNEGTYLDDPISPNSLDSTSFDGSNNVYNPWIQTEPSSEHRIRVFKES